MTSPCHSAIQPFLKKWLTFLYSFFDFLYSNNKKIDKDADIEANNVSEENAIIIDFSYVCEMDYTAAKVSLLEYKNDPNPLILISQVISTASTKNTRILDRSGHYKDQLI